MSIKRKKRKIALLVVVVLLASLCGYVYSLRITPPDQDLSVIDPTLRRVQKGNTYQYGNNWLRKERDGLWYMYVEGEDFQRGYAMGMLSKELVQNQEAYFVNELNNKLPSRIYQFILKLFVGWFNRDLDQHIPLEYRNEIHGVSLAASPEYDYIAPAYQRMLNYHAAHDIGHALQNMHLVACTAIGAWNQCAEDSTMYIGRNFDFYVGDDFAKDKIIAFVNPKRGHKFMMVTWGGMCGVLSGMNVQGLTVTLNADKSGVPPGSGTPVSIIAREVLQYATTIEEAYAIASKYNSFVSESFMIGSANDRKVAVIEKTPEITAIYYPEEERIICANHFQSKELHGTALNVEDMHDSTSVYRQQRVAELLEAAPKMNAEKMAALLRDQGGMGSKSIGMGNPKAINQLIAHHSVIFNPYKKLVWVSTSPYQLGDYLAIHLEDVFASGNSTQATALSDPALTIPADPFLHSSSYQKFTEYRKTAAAFSTNLNNEEWMLTPKQIREFISSNPDYYHPYQLVGDYFGRKKAYGEAISYYQLALQREMPSVADRESLRNKLKACQEKLAAEK